MGFALVLFATAPNVSRPYSYMKTMAIGLISASHIASLLDFFHLNSVTVTEEPHAILFP